MHDARDRPADPHGRTLKAFAARIAELERERAAAIDENRRLVAVADATKSIAAVRDVDGIVARLLRAMRDPLGFSRAMYFSVDRVRGIEARVQLDGSDAVEPCEEALDIAQGSVVLGVLRGDPDGIGRAGDLSAPIVDVRAWYVLCALAGNDGAFGMLYVDGHAHRTPDDGLASHVRSIAAVAAIAIESAALFARTQTLASRDPLTGLFNRRVFEERLEQTIRDSEALRRSFAYVMIDVDDFKSINDRFGHARGDDVLRELAAALTASSRSGDVVGRYAGDEFAVMMTNLDAELLRARVARLSGDLRARDLRCSIGVAIYPRDAHDARGLVEAADSALYATKAAGKNGFSFFERRPPDDGPPGYDAGASGCDESTAIFQMPSMRRQTTR